MDAGTLRSLFPSALKDAGLDFKIEDAPLPCGFLVYGTFALVENPEIAAQVCDTVARQTGAFHTFTEFKRLPNQSPLKPVKPDPEDPAFIPPYNKSYPPELIAKHGLQKIRTVDTAKNYNLAYKDYETRNESHERLLSQIRTVRASYSLDERGYLDWVLFSLPAIMADFAQDFFFTPRTLLIKEEDRKKHTFITGGTGSGKSETKKHIIWHYLTKNTDTAVIVLDPHDKLAREVAKMAPNADNDRLVFVKPGMFKDRYIGLNPFDFAPRDEESLNIAQKHFLGAFEQILGHELSDAQQAILTPCLGVMLHREDSTLHDLIRFMDDKLNSDLVAYGCTKLPNEADKTFMRTQFDGENFAPTKQAISYRLSRIVRDPTVRNFLCRESTFDFEACIEQGKVIVFGFDRAKQDASVVTTIGQLINALLFSYSMRRGDGRGKPIHLFADECQYFVSPTIEEILGESRKFQLYATLATQRTNQVGREVLDAIFGNVGCFLIGRNRAATAEKMGKELEIKPDDIRGLNNLQFYQVGLDQPPTKTRIRYIGRRRSMKREQWRDVMIAQRDQYYRWETDFSTSTNVTGFNEARPHQGGIENAPALPSDGIEDDISALPPIPDVTKRH